MLIAGEGWQDGSEACSVPDLKVHLVPVLQTRPLLPLCIGGCQGDGQSVERGWSSSTRRLVLSTSSSAPDDGRWRLLLLLLFERSNSGRWPALQSSSVNFLVEGRPPSLSSRLYGRQSLLLLGGFGLQSQPWRPLPPQVVRPRRRRARFQAAVVLWTQS